MDDKVIDQIKNFLVINIKLKKTSIHILAKQASIQPPAFSEWLLLEGNLPQKTVKQIEKIAQDIGFISKIEQIRVFLKNRDNRKGASIKWIAEKIGTQRSTISQWLNELSNTNKKKVRLPERFHKEIEEIAKGMGFENK